MLKIMEKSPNLLGKKIVLILTMSSHVPLQVLHMFLKLLILLAPSPHNPNEKWF